MPGARARGVGGQRRKGVAGSVDEPAHGLTDVDEFLASAAGNHELHHRRNQSTRHSRTLRGMSRAARPRRPGGVSGQDAMRSPIRTVRRHNNPLVRWDALGYTLEMLRGAKGGTTWSDRRGRGDPRSRAVRRRGDAFHAPTPAPGSPDRPVWRRRPTPCASRLTTQRASPSSHSRTTSTSPEKRFCGASTCTTARRTSGSRSCHSFEAKDLASRSYTCCAGTDLWFVGLHRLQVETLVDNAPMLAAAARLGFERDGVLRGAAWANGQFTDEAVLGLLASDWSDS